MASDSDGQSVSVTVEATGDAPPRRAVFVCEGWWHPNVKSGQVHLHPEQPNGNWSVASHRLCEPVYTRRKPTTREGRCG